MAAFSESEGELQRLVGEASKRALTADERAEAAEHLDQLETEAKMMPSAQRDDVMARARQYRGELERGELLGGVGVKSEGATTAQHRRRLEDVGERQEKTNETLRATHKLCAEIEEVGGDIIGDLKEQREKIKGIQTKQAAVNGELDKANSVLKRMGKWWNRI